MASFADIANNRIADIERPPIPPKGMYRWQITKPPTIDDMAAGAYEKVAFFAKAVENYTADEDELKAFGGIKNIAQTKEFIFDKNDDTKFAQTQFGLKTFLERHLQIEGAEAMTMTQALNATVNSQFDGELTWRQDKNDASLFFSSIGKTAPVRS